MISDIKKYLYSPTDLNLFVKDLFLNKSNVDHFYLKEQIKVENLKGKLCFNAVQTGIKNICISYSENKIIEEISLFDSFDVTIDKLKIIYSQHKLVYNKRDDIYFLCINLENCSLKFIFAERESKGVGTISIGLVK